MVIPSAWLEVVNHTFGGNFFRLPSPNKKTGDKMMHWSNYLDIYFYQYLFRKADNSKWNSNNLIKDWWNRLVCRFKGHPCGCIFYNPGEYEPDFRCKNCGDEL